MDGIKNWLKDSANILFDDSRNDLRALPKTVRLQILLVLSFIWSTVFSLYIFSYTTFAFGWAGTFIAHIGLIFAVYYTFKQFHNVSKNKYKWGYHSYGRAREYVIYRDKFGNPFKVNLPKGDPGGEHE